MQFAGDATRLTERGRASHDDDIRLRVDEFSRVLSHQRSVAFGPAIVDHDILVIDPPELFQVVTQCLDPRRIFHSSQQHGYSARLVDSLGACERRGKKHPCDDEKLSPFHLANNLPIL